jgi:hypothetical protein
MVMGPVGLGPENDHWQGQPEIINHRPVLFSEGVCPTAANPQLSDSNMNLVMRN